MASPTWTGVLISIHSVGFPAICLRESGPTPTASSRRLPIWGIVSRNCSASSNAHALSSRVAGTSRSRRFGGVPRSGLGRRQSACIQSCRTGEGCRDAFRKRLAWQYPRGTASSLRNEGCIRVFFRRFECVLGFFLSAGFWWRLRGFGRAARKEEAPNEARCAHRTCRVRGACSPRGRRICPLFEDCFSPQRF